MAALHAGGVIHRDLKPNNVMLETGGSGLHVSIMDFGLARPHEAANTLFGSGVIAGTPGYMAPELLRGGRPTKATDLFALGIVLHQVLTGERPPEAAGGLSPTPSPSLRSTRSPALVQAVEGFLSPDPEIRIRAFERVWPEQTGVATLGRRSLWTPRIIGYTGRRDCCVACDCTGGPQDIVPGFRPTRVDPDHVIGRAQRRAAVYRWIAALF